MNTLLRDSSLEHPSDVDAVQAMLNQAEDAGTLTPDQEATLAEMAKEVGTTLEALKRAREVRNEKAGKRIAGLLAQVNPQAVRGNAEDHWAQPKQ